MYYRLYEHNISITQCLILAVIRQGSENMTNKTRWIRIDVPLKRMIAHYFNNLGMKGTVDEWTIFFNICSNYCIYLNKKNNLTGDRCPFICI